MAKLCVAFHAEKLKLESNGDLSAQAQAPTLTAIGNPDFGLQCDDEQFAPKVASARDVEADERSWLEKVSQAYKDGLRKGMELGREQLNAELKTAEDIKVASVSSLLATLNKALVQVQSAREELARSGRAEILEVIFEAVTRIIAEDYVVDPKRIDFMLSPMLDRISGSRWAALVVSPPDYELLKASGESTGSINLPSFVRLEASESVEPGGAILRTETGELDFRLTTKLEQFKQLLLRHTGTA